MLLVFADQLVERLDQRRCLDVLASELGVREILLEVIPEHRVLTQRVRTFALDDGLAAPYL